MLGYNDQDPDVDLDLEAILGEMELTAPDPTPAISYVPVSLVEQKVITPESMETNTNEKKLEEQNRVQIEKLKLMDPTSKSVLFTDSLRQLIQYDPPAYVSFVTAAKTDVKKSEKNRLIAQRNFDFTKDPTQLELPKLTAIDVNTYKLKYDVVFYSYDNIYYNDDIKLSYNDPHAVNISLIYNDLKRLINEDFSIERLGVWRQFSLDQIFAGNDIPYDNFIIANIDDRPALFVRTIQKDIYIERIKNIKNFFAKELRLTDLKTMRNNSFQVHSLPFGNASNRKKIRAFLKSQHVRIVHNEKTFFFNANHMNAIELYVYLSNAQSQLKNDIDFLTTSYAISYYNTLPKEMAMFSLKNWINHLRIDGYPCCAAPRKKVQTPDYKTIGHCTDYVCYCYNPFRDNPLNLKRLLEGSFANYIRLASDITDTNAGSSDGQKPELSLHFTMEQNILCGICRQNASKCNCHINPEKALRARGLYNTYIGRQFVILGKPHDHYQISPTLDITHCPDLITFVPQKRKKIYLVVPDGRNIRSFDPANEKLLHNTLGVVNACTMPLVIYNHPKYNKVEKNPALYNFLAEKVNKLADVNSISKRKEEAFATEDQITSVIQMVIDYYRDKKSQITNIRKRRLEETRQVRDQFKNVCLNPLEATTTTNLPSLVYRSRDYGQNKRRRT